MIKTTLMKIFFTFPLFLIFTTAWSQHLRTDDPSDWADKLKYIVSSCQLPKKDSIVKPRIRIRCGLIGDIKPLIIVDKKVVSDFNGINTDDIKDIFVLNGPESQAIFGIQGKDGAIVITLRVNYERILIKDFSDKAPIPKATVTFVFPEGKDTLRYIADDSGVVISNSLSKLKGCQMIVSSAGYKTRTSVFQDSSDNLQREIFLEKNVKVCDEAIITCYDCLKWIRCGVSKVKIVRVQRGEILSADKNKISLFPNPAKAGQAITIQKSFHKEEMIEVRVLQANGSLVSSQFSKVSAGISRISIITGSHWPGGTYFIHLLYANGRMAASSKVIIQ